MITLGRGYFSNFTYCSTIVYRDLSTHFPQCSHLSLYSAIFHNFQSQANFPFSCKLKPTSHAHQVCYPRTPGGLQNHLWTVGDVAFRGLFPNPVAKSKGQPNKEQFSVPFRSPTAKRRNFATGPHHIPRGYTGNWQSNSSLFWFMVHWKDSRIQWKRKGLEITGTNK